MPSQYEQIYTRLVAGDRQGAARRIADATTSGRLVKYDRGEEVLLIRERDGLVLLRRERDERSYWTRQEAITSLQPSKTNEFTPIESVASPTQDEPKPKFKETPMVQMPKIEVAKPDKSEIEIDNLEVAEEQFFESPDQKFERWLIENPKPRQEYYSWQSADEKYTTDGQFVSLNNDNVTIRKRDGKEVIVARSLLSEETNRMLERHAIPGLANYKRSLRVWERAADAQKVED